MAKVHSKGVLVERTSNNRGWTIVIIIGLVPIRHPSNMCNPGPRNNHNNVPNRKHNKHMINKARGPIATIETTATAAEGTVGTGTIGTR